MEKKDFFVELWKRRGSSLSFGRQGNLGVAPEEKRFLVEQMDKQVMKYEHPTLTADSKSSRTTGHLTPRASGDPRREGFLHGALGEKELCV